MTLSTVNISNNHHQQQLQQHQQQQQQLAQQELSSEDKISVDFLQKFKQKRNIVTGINSLKNSFHNQKSMNNGQNKQQILDLQEQNEVKEIDSAFETIITTRECDQEKFLSGIKKMQDYDKSFGHIWKKAFIISESILNNFQTQLNLQTDRYEQLIKELESVIEQKNSDCANLQHQLKQLKIKNKNENNNNQKKNTPDLPDNQQNETERVSLQIDILKGYIREQQNYIQKQQVREQSLIKIISQFGVGDLQSINSNNLLQQIQQNVNSLNINQEITKRSDRIMEIIENSLQTNYVNQEEFQRSVSKSFSEQNITTFSGIVPCYNLLDQFEFVDNVQKSNQNDSIKKRFSLDLSILGRPLNSNKAEQSFISIVDKHQNKQCLNNILEESVSPFPKQETHKLQQQHLDQLKQMQKVL